MRRDPHSPLLDISVLSLLKWFYFAFQSSLPGQDSQNGIFSSKEVVSFCTNPSSLPFCIVVKVFLSACFQIWYFAPQIKFSFNAVKVLSIGRTLLKRGAMQLSTLMESRGEDMPWYLSCNFCGDRTQTWLPSAPRRLMRMIAFITFNSSLVPLFEGVWSSNPWEFEWSGF